MRQTPRPIFRGLGWRIFRSHQEAVRRDQPCVCLENRGNFQVRMVTFWRSRACVDLQRAQAFLEKLGRLEMRIVGVVMRRLRSCYGFWVLLTESGWSHGPAVGSTQFLRHWSNGVRPRDRMTTTRHRVWSWCRSIRRSERMVVPSEHELTGNSLRKSHRRQRTF